MEGRFANLKMHESYAAFAQAFCTRLGIGPTATRPRPCVCWPASRPGTRFPPWTTYTRLVLERPGTYAAADAAVEHFKDLEDAYEAMESEAKKAEVLAPIPTLWGERGGRTRASSPHRHVRSRIRPRHRVRVGRLTTEDPAPRRRRGLAFVHKARVFEKAKRAAQGREADLNISKANVEADLGENESHTTVARLDADLGRLRLDQEAARERRDTFDRLTARLGLTIETEDDFDAARATSKAFLEGFQASSDDLDRQKALLNRQVAAPLMRRTTSLSSGSLSRIARGGWTTACMSQGLRWQRPLGCDLKISHLWVNSSTFATVSRGGAKPSRRPCSESLG